MKKYLSFVLLLLCFNLVYALEITATYDSNVIIKELKNPIPVTLKITDAEQGNYNVFSLSDILIEPSEVFKIETSEYTKELIFKPTENLNVEGLYTFSYTLNHRGVEKYEKRFIANIVPISKALEIESDSLESSKEEVYFYVKNTQNVAILDLPIRFSSILFNFEKKLKIKPLEKIRVPVTVDPERFKTTKAGVYIITGEISTPLGKSMIEGNLYLGEKKNIETDVDDGGLIIRTSSVTKVNTGNTVESVQINIEKNIISRLFTTFSKDPNYVLRDGGIVRYTWIKERLEPGESLKVTAKTNYTLPLIVIILVVLVVLGFKRYGESKLDIIKSVSPVKTKNEEFALRITLSIKGRKRVDNVTVIDRVPAIVKVYNKFGIVKPSRIDATARRISWNLGSLSSGEERTLTYIVYSKVGVVGKFVLPSATTVFESDGKVHEVESNQVFFLSGQTSNID